MVDGVDIAYPASLSRLGCGRGAFAGSAQLPQTWRSDVGCNEFLEKISMRSMKIVSDQKQSKPAD